MLKSLELGWLAKKDRNLPLPELVYSPNPKFGGLYMSPWKGERQVGTKFYDTSKGLIWISEFTPSVIAHEWRHHYQFYYGPKPGPSSLALDKWTAQYGYKGMIKKYFTELDYEQDALKFQVKMYPKDLLTEYWIDLLKWSKKELECCER